MDDLKLALLVNAVHPGVGGVLVRGEKGTAKSTAVRALAALLPALDVVPGCRFGCAPGMPDPACPDGPHPAGVAPDIRPARLVDLLLDAAAMGRAHVERDGVSVSHAARFLLVGTMNPEEGELRPQLLDRFGLTVEVRSARDVETRVEVVRRRLAFEADPAGFVAAWQADETATARRIADARTRVDAVALPDPELRRIAAVCAAFDVDGMRADLVIARAAVAHAAWRGADAVAEEDVRVGARLALPHRRRRDPFDEPGMDEQALDDALRDADQEPPEGPDDGGPGGGAPEPGEAPASGSDAGSPRPAGDGRAQA